jgi:hypothetical protein
VIESLDSQSQLNVFSIGQNQIKKLDNVMYLRQFGNLRLVNLAGNPISKVGGRRAFAVLCFFPCCVVLCCPPLDLSLIDHVICCLAVSPGARLPGVRLVTFKDLH